MKKKTLREHIELILVNSKHYDYAAKDVIADTQVILDAVGQQISGCFYANVLSGYAKSVMDAHPEWDKKVIPSVSKRVGHGIYAHIKAKLKE